MIEPETDDARETLVRALDQLDELRDEHGEAVRVYVVVSYAHQIEGETHLGWTSTDDPRFVSAGLLREVADAIDSCRCDRNDDEDDE